MDKLLASCNRLCAQETFLSKQDLEKTNCLHKDFHGVGESTSDLSSRVVRGGISSGVAILWHKMYDQLVNVVGLKFDWAIGIEIIGRDRKFTILNVYVPYECPQNEVRCLNRLSYVLNVLHSGH